MSTKAHGLGVKSRTHAWTQSIERPCVPIPGHRYRPWCRISFLMITALRFDDAPEFIRQLDVEWHDMDRRSSTCARPLSARTSYYTLDEHRSCDEDLRSSSDSSHKRTPFHAFFDPLIDLSRRLLGKDVDHNASIAVDADHRTTINRSKNVSQV
jgi:hypothetical protein